MLSLEWYGLAGKGQKERISWVKWLPVFSIHVRRNHGRNITFSINRIVDNTFKSENFNFLLFKFSSMIEFFHSIKNSKNDFLR